MRARRLRRQEQVRLLLPRYGSPSPGAEPFVKIGAYVEDGETLCIVEAMKLMNEIESDSSGEVLRIFVENGQPVEYGQPLFGIRPSRKK